MCIRDRGTPIEKVIEFCGGYRGDPAKILMGGPMMGLALDSDALPVLKQNNAILAFQEQDAVLPAPTACIHCGRCVEGCPMHLMLSLIHIFIGNPGLRPVLPLAKAGIRRLPRLRLRKVSNCFHG